MEKVQRISIIPRTPTLSLPRAAAAASAIQLQVLNDFCPFWKKMAVVTASSSPQTGYIPIFVMDNVADGLSGYHFTEDGSPYAIVHAGAGWSLAASHEILELLVDPDADTRVNGITPDGNGTCDYILEVCDPCQHANYSYNIDGWSVSDFCLPKYFDARVSPDTTGTFSFKNHLTAPRQVLPGGTLAWITSDGRAHQSVHGATGMQTFDRGVFVAGAMQARRFMGRFDETIKEVVAQQIPLNVVKKNNRLLQERKLEAKELSLMFDAHIEARLINLNK